MGSPFGIGNKESTSSNTTNNTTNTYTDKSANAGGDNSMALAEGSAYNSTGAGGLSTSAGRDVSITTSDPLVVGAALHTVEAQNQLTAAQYIASLNAMQGSQVINANSQKATQDAANLAIQSSQSLASQLAGGGALQTPTSAISIAQTLGKYGAYVAIALAVLVALFFLTKRKGTK